MKKGILASAVIAAAGAAGIKIAADKTTPKIRISVVILPLRIIQNKSNKIYIVFSCFLLLIYMKAL